MKSFLGNKEVSVVEEKKDGLSKVEIKKSPSQQLFDSLKTFSDGVNVFATEHAKSGKYIKFYLILACLVIGFLILTVIGKYSYGYFVENKGVGELLSSSDRFICFVGDKNVSYRETGDVYRHKQTFGNETMCRLI